MKLLPKDYPTHMPSDCYIRNLKWLSAHYIALWDEEEKRCWLVSGTSALLHLTRSSLQIYSEDAFSSEFQFDPAEMLDDCIYTPTSAIPVLINCRNRSLEVYRGKMESIEEDFEGLVKKHFRTMEAIIERHKHAARRDGINLDMGVRKYLEGYDYADIANGHDLRPRVAALQALEHGWVDLLHAVEAVPLFGRGFGDLILPSEPDQQCTKWNKLPVQKYHLAVSVYDMLNIIQAYDDRWSDPSQATESLIWHCPNGAIMKACKCGSPRVWAEVSLGFRHHDPVHVLLPEVFSAVKVTRLFKPPAENGAIVFGHNNCWKHRWEEDGQDDTLEEHEPTIASTAEEKSYQSTISSAPGTSLSPSGSNAQEGFTDPSSVTSPPAHSPSLISSQLTSKLWKAASMEQQSHRPDNTSTSSPESEYERQCLQREARRPSAMQTRKIPSRIPIPVHHGKVSRRRE